MLTTILLSDAELAQLSRHEGLAVEHLIHERLSEAARAQHSGDRALLLAIKSAEFLEPLLDELGDDGCDALIATVRCHDVARVALSRADQVAQLARGARAA